MAEVIAITAVSFLVGLLIMYLYEKFRKKSKGVVVKVKKQLSTDEILGKSHFKVSHSKPQVRSYPKGEKPENKENIFAGESKNGVPDSAEREGKETSEDYPAEFDAEAEDDNINLGEEAGESIEATDKKTEIIGGIELTALQYALEVIERQNATQQQKQKAGDILSLLEQTNISDGLRSDPERSKRIDELIAVRLKFQPFIRIDEENTCPPSAEKGNLDFDIRDYL